MHESITRTILRHVGDLGYQVISEPGRLVAVDHRTGERHVVTFDDGDRYRAACELAQLVGVDLEDG